MKKEYYIKLKDGQAVPVSEEIYREYMHPVWREAKRKAVRHDVEFSFDFMVENGMGHFCASDQKLVDEIIEDKLLLETLMKALELLSDDERFLIDELYFYNKSERDVANATNKAKTTIHDTKMRILKKLLTFFEK